MHRHIRKKATRPISPRAASERLLLVGTPLLTAGTAAYAALASDYLRGYTTLSDLPLLEMGENLIGSAVILLLGALILVKWR